MYYGSRVALEMCSIQNNVATSEGGGIYLYSSNTVVHLYGVSFSGNTSPDGPDIYRESGSIKIHS